MVISHPDRITDLFPAEFSRTAIWKERLQVEADLFNLLDLARFLTDEEVDKVGTLLIKVIVLEIIFFIFLFILFNFSFLSL